MEFEPLPTGTYADTFFGLLEALESLFGRPVDLVVASSRTRTSESRSNRTRLSSTRPEAKKYFYDMQQAAALLSDFTAGKSFDDYTSDPMLPLHHRDPFDRLLYCQAQVEGLRVISNDDAFARYNVDPIW